MGWFCRSFDLVHSYTIKNYLTQKGPFNNISKGPFEFMLLSLFSRITIYLSLLSTLNRL